jgi:O-antigen/teichoic acid export membrane protein
MLVHIRKAFSNPVFRKYFGNTSWMGVEKGLRLLVNLTVGIWIIRYLGPDEFGVFSFAQSFVFLFATIGTLGLDRIVVRELVKSPDQRSVILGSAFGLRLMGALTVFPLLGLALYAIGTGAYVNILVLIIAMGGLFQTFAVIDYDFQAKVQAKYSSVASLVALTLSALIKVSLILTAAPLVAFVVMLVFDALFFAVSLIWIYWRRGQEIRSWKFQWCTARSLVSESWPLMLTGILVAVYMRIDQIMLERMSGFEAVGVYAAAARLSEIWYIIPVVATASLFPGIVGLRKQNLQHYRQANQAFFDAMALIALFVVVPIAIFSPFLVSVLFGPAYTESAAVLQIHIWAGIFVCFSVVSGGWYSAEGLQKMSFYRSILGCCTNVGLNLLLIPRYGPIGAAIATVVATALAGYAFDAFSPRSRELFMIKSRALNVFAGIVRLKRAIGDSQPVGRRPPAD